MAERKNKRAKEFVYVSPEDLAINNRIEMDTLVSGKVPKRNRYRKFNTPEVYKPGGILDAVKSVGANVNIESDTSSRSLFYASDKLEKEANGLLESSTEIPRRQYSALDNDRLELMQLNPAQDIPKKVTHKQDTQALDNLYLQANNNYDRRNVSQIKPNYVAYSSGRIDDMSRANVPAPIRDLYKKIRIEKEVQANAAKYKADFVSGADGIYRTTGTGNAIVPVGNVIDTTAETVEPQSDKKPLQKKIESTGTSKVSIDPAKGPIEYSSDELLADNIEQVKAKKVYGIGRKQVYGTRNIVAPYRTVKPEAPSKAMKYGSYALGALAATALVNTMFFGDKKGEQTNAQLYGQQPLY